MKPDEIVGWVIIVLLAPPAAVLLGVIIVGLVKVWWACLVFLWDTLLDGIDLFLSLFTR